MWYSFLCRERSKTALNFEQEREMARHTYSTSPGTTLCPARQKVVQMWENHKSMFKFTKFNGSGEDPENKWDSTTRNNTKWALVQEGKWRTHKLWQLSMLLPAWAQHLAPSSLQTPDPLAHLMAKTLPGTRVCRASLWLGDLKLFTLVHYHSSQQQQKHSTHTYSHVFPPSEVRILLCFH